ncbi:hypothetical protein QVD17_19292 [Tagetes erecta]|uniref:Uncharacterized protein n=1 Tax=Tagetes erecta TaxID=13708 RepID=A0AAD8KMC2_TARER|nr:hypothetical protein QVD17_19292 [Tagetes erecta]
MKINSCLVFALLLLLVTYTLADETLQHEAATQKAKGARDKVEPTYNGGGGGHWGGGGGGGHWGGGGGGCHHGCCYKGPYGCKSCCSSAEEAKAYAEKQAHP